MLCGSVIVTLTGFLNIFGKFAVRSILHQWLMIVPRFNQLSSSFSMFSVELHLEIAHSQSLCVCIQRMNA